MINVELQRFTEPNCFILHSVLLISLEHNFASSRVYSFNRGSDENCIIILHQDEHFLKITKHRGRGTVITC